MNTFTIKKTAFPAVSVWYSQQYQDKSAKPRPTAKRGSESHTGITKDTFSPLKPCGLCHICAKKR